MLCITKNSIKHVIFYTQINDQTVLFDPSIGPFQVLPPRARMDLGTIAIKGYAAFPKAIRLEAHHQIVSCHIQDTLWGCLTSLQRCNQSVLQPQPTELLKNFVHLFLKNFLHSVVSRLGLVSFFNDISTCMDYLIPKPSLEKNSSDTI